MIAENFDLAAVRRRKIAELVAEHGSMGVRGLSDRFDVSEATIRRDLKVLDQNGVLLRTHGGVMVNSSVVADLPNEVRKSVGAEEKRRIGAAAIGMLGGDEVVFLDAGTTALAAAFEAHRRPGCTYVTTSLGVAGQLQSQGIERFFLVGGAYEKANDSFVGTLAIAALRSLSFDIAFLCCSSIDLARRSISLGSEVYAQVQKEVVEVSRKRIVIADSSKFKSSAFVQSARFAEIDGFITNEGEDPEVIKRLKEIGMDVVLA